MKKPRYETILMDADETLFDFERAAREAIEKTMRRNGLPFGEGTWLLYRRYNDEVWAEFEQGKLSKPQLQRERFVRLFRKLGISADIETVNRTYIQSLGEGSYILPGAYELCRTLYSSCGLYIVTNGIAQVQESRFAASPLKPYIRKMYVSENIGYQKPQREFFDAVLKDLKVTDRRSVIILGDSLSSDMAGGANAGIDTCWYHPGEDFPPSGLLDGITYRIRELSEFVPIALGK